LLAAYQLDRAQRNLRGYAVLSNPRPLGVRTLRGLGAAVPITAAQAFQQALSMYSGQHVNPRDSGNAAWVSANEAQIQAGQFDPYPGCSGQAPTLNLFSTVSGLSLSAAGAATGIATAVGAIGAGAGIALGAATMGVGLIISVIGMIFAHHAAAVKRDENFSCGAVPAVNNAFQLIAQSVQSGQTTPAAVAAALPEIYSQFMKAGGANGSISGPSGVPSGGTAINNSPYCNSNCELSICVLGMVLFWQAQYQAMAESASSAGATAAPPPTVAIAPVVTPATASKAAQPGSGSAGAGPAPAPIVSSGSTLAIPAPVAAATSTSLPSWIFLAAAAVVGLVAAEAF
jgi:hypothetical protein